MVFAQAASVVRARATAKARTQARARARRQVVLRRARARTALCTCARLHAGQARTHTALVRTRVCDCAYTVESWSGCGDARRQWARALAKDFRFVRQHSKQVRCSRHSSVVVEQKGKVKLCTSSWYPVLLCICVVSTPSSRVREERVARRRAARLPVVEAALVRPEGRRRATRGEGSRGWSLGRGRAAGGGLP